MTPMTFALWYCKERGYDLEQLKTGKHMCEASKLNGLIRYMRHHSYRFWEISDVVDRTNDYCRAVCDEPRKKRVA